ncbi:hypothetical protein N9B53_04270 [Mariniblastus sp.]|nr:hypothetical protein [Mariniblastus sp.]MDA7933016.1 hypothetical protein [Mariniblastus sp.]
MERLLHILIFLPDELDKRPNDFHVRRRSCDDAESSASWKHLDGPEILAEFSTATGAKIVKHRWMEKFGEWFCEYPARDWKPGGKVVWEVDVLVPGDYNVSLTYAGEGRLVWGVEVVGGEHIQNQQNASHNYQKFPIGWLNFPAAGKYKVVVSCLEGDTESASLKSIQFERVN